MFTHETIWTEIIPSLTWSRGWHSKEDNQIHCKYASYLDGEHIIEVGTAEGESLISMLLSSKDNVSALIVDPNITMNLLTNIRAMGLGKRVCIVPATSDDALIPFLGQIGILHIDAVHTYENVKKDLEKYSLSDPKFIVLHDTSLEGVKRAVDEFIALGKYMRLEELHNITVLTRNEK